jgi:uncharacterized protein YndB with AHSA1/START domain
MNINIKAPMSARKEILIEAPIEKVWSIQTDIERWPEWQPDITSAKLQGNLTAGTVFRWKAKGLGITSMLHTVEPNHKIGWTGTSIGMGAIHNWAFEPQANGTLVITEESLSGWFTRLMKFIDPRFLEKSLEASLRILKARVEAQIQ